MIDSDYNDWTGDKGLAACDLYDAGANIGAIVNPMVTA